MFTPTVPTILFSSLYILQFGLGLKEKEQLTPIKKIEDYIHPALPPAQCSLSHDSSLTNNAINACGIIGLFAGTRSIKKSAQIYGLFTGTEFSSVYVHEAIGHAKTMKVFMPDTFSYARHLDLHFKKGFPEMYASQGFSLSAKGKEFFDAHPSIDAVVAFAGPATEIGFLLIARKGAQKYITCQKSSTMLQGLMNSSLIHATNQLVPWSHIAPNSFNEHDGDRIIVAINKMSEK